MTPEQFGPEYNVKSATLGKFRFRAKAGLRAMTYEQRQAYGAAVEEAVLSSQRSFLKSHGESMPTPVCASGTWHTTGEAIDAAVRQQQRAALLAYPAKIHRERTPEQWQSLYADAMKSKLEATP